MAHQAPVRGGVVGGALHQVAPPRQFITNTPLVVADNTRIVAVASPDEKTGSPAEDGWILSDFYALNYLYRGQGTSQVWLTAADPLVLLGKDKKYRNFLHGNPYQERKVVLSRELLEAGQLTYPTVVPPSQMNDRFAEEIKKAAAAAVEDGGNVLVFVFCHGMKGRFCLDATADATSSSSSDSSESMDAPSAPEDVDDSKCFTLKDLHNAAGPHVRLTLVSTACYSGGWLVCPDINATGMAAAPPGKVSNSWVVSQSVGRACGSMFISALVGGLTSTSSTLLPEEDRNAPDDKPKHLQPKNPTETQTLTYNAFCCSMMDILGTRLYRKPESQHFTFSAQDDDWEAAWTERTGMELARYEHRWSQLVTYPYTGPQEKKDNFDPSPLNTTFQAGGRGGQGLERTGGGGQQRGSRSADMLDLMASQATKRRVRLLAKLFSKTCPGDENTAWGIPLNSMLRRCIATGNPQKEDGGELRQRWNLFAIVQYRIDVARLADSLVDAFQLPRPGGTECLMWDTNGPHGWDLDRMGLATSFDDVSSWLLPYGAPRRTPEQGPPFDRFAIYLNTALTLANKDKTTTRQIAEQINAAVADVRTQTERRLLADPEVRQRSREWARSIGRHMRESLSPRKRSA